MVSMKDISNKVGVSVATVSKALNDHSDIGEATKQKVREAAREMGYFPNASARTLKTNSVMETKLQRIAHKPPAQQRQRRSVGPQHGDIG